MINTKIGHYAIGPRDGGSEWHLGTTLHRQCQFSACIALFKDELEIKRLRGLLSKAAGVIHSEFCANGWKSAHDCAAAEYRAALDPQVDNIRGDL